MDKAYYPTIWENLPAETSPLDEINLNAISRGLSVVDDRVIDLDTRVKDTVNSVTFDNNTGVLRIIKDDGRDFNYNLTSKVLSTIDDIQQQNRVSFNEIAVNFQDVRTLLDNMDMKIDLTAEGANAGLRDVQTTIEENDGYYRREMSGIRDSVSSVSGEVDALNRYMTEYSSSIIQTTQAIQLSVQEVTQSVDDLGNAVEGDMTILRSQINQTAGQIALKVSKLEVIDDLQQEFGSGIEITPDRITFASTGAMVVNTDNFKLDEEGNAEFKGHVAMDSGSVGGVPLMANPADSDNAMSVQHANNSWKLRSALINKETGLRYYTYMTKNKHLIVSDDESAGHTEENDKTDECTIGSKSYPWGAGYFKKLLVNKHSVIPEGIEITLEVLNEQGQDNWTAASGGWYEFSIEADGVKPGKTFFSIAAKTNAALQDIYGRNMEVACVRNNEIIVLSETKPSQDISLIILAEDYDIPAMEGAVLTASFDGNYGQLSCNWESPDTGSVFFSWVSDEICIEEWDETNEEWVETTILPAEGEEPLENDQFEDDPCIIG